MEIFGQSLKRLRAFLDLEHRGMNISPNVLTNQELDFTFFDDLNHVINWLKEHIEVKFLRINFHIEQTSVPTFTNEQDYIHYRKRCRDIFDGISSLPQVIIMDFQGQFESVWCEFLLYSNFSIADISTTFNINHLKRGILPISSKIKDLDRNLKNLFITSRKLSGRDLKSYNAIDDFYESHSERQAKISEIKNNIFLSSPSGVIQFKHALHSDRTAEYEKIIHFTYLNDDWKNDGGFTSVHEMKKILNDRAISNNTENLKE